MLVDFKAPTPAPTMPHPIPEGIDGVILMCNSTSNESKMALFAMQGLMALRVSEARGITHRHIDTVERVMIVRGKGDKTRHVMLSNRAWEYIEPGYKLSIHTDAPIVDLSDRGARKAVTAMGRKLKFKRPISSHDLRATCATEMFNRTSNIRATQELLGHSSLNTTQIYTAVSRDTMREGLEF